MVNTSEIAELEAKLAEKKKEKAKFDAMPERQRLAEIIHEKQCTWNHTDGCGWYYESWEKPGYSRNEYLEKADKLLKIVDYDTAIKVVDCL